MLDSETVETASSAPDNSAKNNLAARIGRTILILATLYICYFSHLEAIGFVGPDEPRYAWIARDMAETGDWVTPRLYGKPWFEKPPLFYWAAALCFKLFGVSEAAARLPSAISALLATLALAWLAFRLYGAETTRWLLLLLPTTVGMIGFSHAAATDMPFSAMLTIAMVCASVVLGLTRSEKSPVLPQTPWLALALFGFFLGLAVLAKGPAGIILVGGAVFSWALFTKRWRDAFRLFHPAALASFFATALPWYILCARRNPDFFRIFIVEHNFKRYLTPEFQHIQPIWYYGPMLLIGLAPWTPMFWSVVKDLAREWNDRSDFIKIYLYCWAAFTVIFFSVSRSKLPGYILPAVPPLALSLSRSISLRIRGILPGKKWIGIAGSAAIVGMTVAIDRLPFAIDYFPPGPLFLVNLVDYVAAIAAMVMALRRRVASALFLSVISIIFTLAVGLTGDTKWSLDLGISARWASKVPEGVTPDYWASHTATYKLRRSFLHGLNFYVHREVPEWNGNKAERNWVFTTPKEMTELGGMGLQCPHFMAFPPVIVCEAGGSADSLPRSGQLQQEK